MTASPSTWRQADGAAVPFAHARLAYAEAAHDVLVKVAGRYLAIVTYMELAEAVQEATGIRTNVPMRHWIGEILGRVSDDCLARGEPPLSALVVRQDETVGDGYAYVLQIANLPIPEDLDHHAAEARLACHRFFGAQLPPGGGRPSCRSPWPTAESGPPHDRPPPARRKRPSGHRQSARRARWCSPQPASATPATECHLAGVDAEAGRRYPHHSLSR